METILRELVAEAGAESRKAGDGLEFVNGDRVFAVSNKDAVELRLTSEIAEAARRTPDTGASTRGDDWVRLSPRDWDDHARDRLGAWFRVAWRLADTGS
ncbi:MAG: hypothetical protein ACR2H0_06440 [Candidatus Limnocylindrales bacterium]